MWTYSLTDSLTLSSSTGAVARKAPETYKEEPNCLASGQGLEGQLSPREKCNKRAHITHTRDTHLVHSTQVTREIVLLGPTRHLLHKAILLIPGDIAVAPNT